MSNGTPINVQYNSNWPTLPSVTKSGSTFSGWYSEFYGVYITSGSKVTITRNITLTAKWDETGPIEEPSEEPSDSVKVSFYYGSTQLFSGRTINVKPGETYNKNREFPDDLPNEIYGDSNRNDDLQYDYKLVFDHWATDRDGDNVITGNSIVTINHDHKIYAVKRRLIYVKGIYSSNKTSTDYVEIYGDGTYGSGPDRWSDLTYSDTPRESDGKIQVGWMTPSKTVITEDTPVYDDMSHYVYPIWEDSPCYKLRETPKLYLKS